MKSAYSSDELQRFLVFLSGAQTSLSLIFSGLAGSIITLLTGMPVASEISDEKSGSVPLRMTLLVVVYPIFLSAWSHSSCIATPLAVKFTLLA